MDRWELPKGTYFLSCTEKCGIFFSFRPPLPSTHSILLEKREKNMEIPLDYVIEIQNRAKDVSHSFQLTIYQVKDVPLWPISSGLESFDLKKKLSASL